jgi:hypothetical protein
MRRRGGIMGIEGVGTSPACGRGRGAVMPRVRAIGSAGGYAVLRGDPITLTLGAPHLDLSHFVGEVSL